MTAQEMKDEFLLLYDKVTNFAAPGYENDEISAFLTKAQLQIVQKFYNPERNVLQQGVEQTEQISRYLQPLVSKPTDLTAISVGSEFNLKRSLYKLPEDHLFTLSERLMVGSSEPCYDGGYVRLDVKTNDEFIINVENPFKKPNLKVGWRMYQEPDEVVIYTDSRLSASKYTIVYLKNPQPIIVGSITFRGVAGPVNSPLVLLSDQIVDEAVMIATGVTYPELLQIKQIQNTNNL